MADIVNLRTARKRRDRAEKERKAAENRALHGRTKAATDTQAIERVRSNALLDGHRIDRQTQPGEEDETP